MTTSVLTTDSTELRVPREWPMLRLANAELLKLRRRRGLMSLTALLTIVPMLIGFGITISLHLHDPAAHGPGGGIKNLAGALGILALLGSVAAVLLGATLGAGDVGAGVFRDLVITGRSRVALFAARIPAGLAVLAVFAATAFTVAALASMAFSGTLKTPTMALVAKSALWITVAIASSFLVALGVSSALGSRSMSIGILLGWQLALAKLLTALSFLGLTRQALLSTATDHYTPSRLGIDTTVSTTGLVAVTVIITWTTVALGLGAWRTATRDA
jgi:hypothetical protein